MYFAGDLPTNRLKSLMKCDWSEYPKSRARLVQFTGVPYSSFARASCKRYLWMTHFGLTPTYLLKMRWSVRFLTLKTLSRSSTRLISRSETTRSMTSPTVTMFSFGCGRANNSRTGTSDRGSLIVRPGGHCVSTPLGVNQKAISDSHWATFRAKATARRWHRPTQRDVGWRIFLKFFSWIY